MSCVGDAGREGGMSAGREGGMSAGREGGMSAGREGGMSAFTLVERVEGICVASKEFTQDGQEVCRVQGEVFHQLT